MKKQYSHAVIYTHSLCVGTHKRYIHRMSIGCSSPLFKILAKFQFLDFNKMLSYTDEFLPIGIAKIVHMSKIWKFPNLFQLVKHQSHHRQQHFANNQCSNNENFVSSGQTLKVFLTEEQKYIRGRCSFVVSCTL